MKKRKQKYAKSVIKYKISLGIDDSHDPIMQQRHLKLVPRRFIPKLSRYFYSLAALLPSLYLACTSFAFAHGEGDNSVEIIEYQLGRFFIANAKSETHKYSLLGIYSPTWNEVQSELNVLELTKKEEIQAKRAADASRHYLERNINSKDVLKITSLGQEDFAGRKLVMLFLPNHVSINLEMVRLGYAYPLWKELLETKQKKQFQKALQLALKKKKGLWKIWQARQKKEKTLGKQKIRYSKQKKIILMSYNLENLFDTQDSPDTQDSTYLPLVQKQNAKHEALCKKNRSRHYRKNCLKLDWTSKRLKTKMKRLAQVIKKAAQGHGPDLLYLQEVENYSILKRFRDKYLGFGHYRIIHFESWDRRGIDVALLSRLLPAALPRYHEIDFNRHTRTRGILHAPLYLPDKKILHAFVFHFPSQAAPTSMRKQAVVFLSLLKKNLPQDALAVAAGDCNIVLSEERKLYPRHVNPFWKVSHYLGCQSCKGTNYYPPTMSWSFFDVFYSSLNFSSKKASWRINPNSIRVFTPLPFQKTKENTPNPYRMDNFSGVSDHWPVLLEIQKVNVVPR